MSFFESDSEDSNDVDRWERIKDKELAQIDKSRKNWGSNKQTYYNSDTQYFELEHDEQQDTIRREEEEVRTIQREQAAMLQQMDFGLEDILGAAPTKSKAAKAKTSKTTANAQQNTAEKKQVKVKQLLAQSPELMGLMNDYTDKNDMLINRVEPIIQLIQGQGLKQALPSNASTAPIISFVKLYEQLLYGYCTSILFYFYLKAHGIDTQGHPVMAKIQQFQTILEQQDDSFHTIEQQLTAIINQSTTKRRRGQQSTEDDDEMIDVMTAPTRSKKQKKNTTDNIDYAQYYLQMASERKNLREARHNAMKKEQKIVQLQEVSSDSTRRRTNTKILKNKGLTRQKSKRQVKISSNVRLKMRTKHDKALQKRKSSVKEYKGKIGDSYTGESQGIKKGLIRSVKL